MKILYYASINARKESGVLRKVYSQVKAWHEMGHEPVLITVSTAKPDQPLIPVPKGILHYDLNSKGAAWFPGSIFKLLNRTLTVFRARRLIRKQEPDIIYLRECIWFPFAGVLFGAGVPVVMEINSVLKTELKYSGLFQRLLYNLFQSGLYARTSGIVGVARGVTASLAGYGKPSVTVANGYDFSAISDKGFPAQSSRRSPDEGSRQSPDGNGRRSLSELNKQFSGQGHRPALLFAGSPGMAWHGLDHVITLARLFPEFDFHLAGEQAPEKPVFPNLIYHGYLSQVQLAALYDRMDIGIGPLALYRTRLPEASPLKVREYLAYGLPVIIGYEDMDVSGKRLDFVLQLDPVTIESAETVHRIREFVLTWKGKRVPRKVAEELVGIRNKEQQRLSFFETIRANH